MNLYKKYTAKPFSFLVIAATLASDNLLRFTKNLSKRIKKLIMKVCDTIINDTVNHISILLRKN